MAVGTETNFILNNGFMATGLVEEATQQSNVFNAEALFTIILGTLYTVGNFQVSTFFPVNDFVSRRDGDDVSVIPDKNLTQAEKTIVEVLRRIGPYAHTMDSFRKIGMNYDRFVTRNATDSEISLLLGQSIAKDVVLEKLNTVISAYMAATSSVAQLNHDALGNISASGLIDGLKLMGDNASNIVAWLMHSKVYYDLVQGQMTLNNAIGVTAAMAGTPASINRPIIVTDSPALVEGTDYYTAGLTIGAMSATDSMLPVMRSENIINTSNISIRMKCDYGYNIDVKGYSYLQTAGKNPDAATIALPGSWSKVSSSHTNCAGILIKST